MSRAYRVTVEEGITRVICSDDKVETKLELLEVLSKEEMAQILEKELEKQGFEKDSEGVMCREDDGVNIEIDPKTGTVSVSSKMSEEANVSGERVGQYYDDMGPGKDKAEEATREQLRKDLEKQIEKKNEVLQKQVTEKLEGALSDVREELDNVANRTTAEALKIKASRMGEIKEMAEDSSGSLRIVVEV